MYRTRLPLSIAFFDASGGGSCRPPTWRRAPPRAADDCPLYNASGHVRRRAGGGAGRPRWAGHRTGSHVEAGDQRRRDSGARGAPIGRSVDPAPAGAADQNGLRPSRDRTADHLAEVVLRGARPPPTARTTPTGWPDHIAWSHGTSVSVTPARWRCARWPRARRRGRRGRRASSQSCVASWTAGCVRHEGVEVERRRHGGVLGLAEAGRRRPATDAERSRHSSSSGSRRRTAVCIGQVLVPARVQQEEPDGRAAVAGAVSPPVAAARAGRRRGRSGLAAPSCSVEIHRGGPSLRS